MYIAVSLVGRKNIGMSSSFSPACLTQYTSFLNPPSSSSSLRSSGSTPSSLARLSLATSAFSLSNRFSGISKGKLTSSCSVLSISEWVSESISFIARHPYGLHTSIPLIGYLLSTSSAASTINGYHALKSSTFDGIPRLALPLPILNTPNQLFIKLPHYFLRKATIKTRMLQATAT